MLLWQPYKTVSHVISISSYVSTNTNWLKISRSAWYQSCILAWGIPTSHLSFPIHVKYDQLHHHHTECIDRLFFSTFPHLMLRMWSLNYCCHNSNQSGKSMKMTGTKAQWQSQMFQIMDFIVCQYSENEGCHLSVLAGSPQTDLGHLHRTKDKAVQSKSKRSCFHRMTTGLDCRMTSLFLNYTWRRGGQSNTEHTVAYIL